VKRATALYIPKRLSPADAGSVLKNHVPGADAPETMKPGLPKSI
jgi:hypothetical protein